MSDYQKPTSQTTDRLPDPYSRGYYGTHWLEGRGLPCDTACKDPFWCIQRKLCKRVNDGEELQHG